MAVLPARAAAADIPYTWRNVAIRGGGYVTGLVYQPAVRDLLYARTDVGGAYRWDAAARRWVALNDDLDAAAADLHGVLSVALDPTDGRRVYLACGSYTHASAPPGALLASTDRGGTWRRTPLPFRLGGNEDGRSTGERLAVDPADPATLLLGTSHDGLWRSSDRGATWTRVTGFPAQAVTLVIFGPARDSGREILVGVADAGGALYRSADGVHWSRLGGGPPALVPQHAAFDAAGAVVVAYANHLGPNGATDGAVWTRTAAGEWRDITPVRPNAAKGDAFGYAGLAVAGGAIVVSTLDRWKAHDEIFRSTDGGQSWKPLLAGATWDRLDAAYVDAMKPHWLGAVAVNPFAAEQIWFVTGYGVWMTPDAAPRGGVVRWEFADVGLEETVSDDLVSPTAGPPLVSAILDLGGFRHDELDRAPAAGMFRPHHGSSSAIAVASRAPEVMVRTHAGSAAGAWSRDGGRTWHDFANAPKRGPGDSASAAAVSADGRRIVWLPKNSVPYVTGDDGGHWTASRGGLESGGDYFIDRVVADPVDAGRFYVYHRPDGAVWVSEDGGASFARRGTVPKGGGIPRTEPGVAGHLWVPTAKGLFASADAGRTFSSLPSVTAARQVGFGARAPGAATATVYVNGEIGGARGVFRSTDAGRTWVQVNDARTQFGWIRAICGDARVFGRVYLATSGRGLVVGEPR